MLTLSYTASERLAIMIAEAGVPGDVVIRLIPQEDRIDLKLDKAQLGDTTFNHEEKVVLAIDEQVSELLADMKLVVKVVGEETELVLIEQLEE